ncbi:MAG TPA: hypothetical protein VKY38_09505 [Azoarcus sp.]|nr:hypothetical protein [Azoarcus sp.]
MSGRGWKACCIGLWMCLAGSAAAHTTLVFEGCVDARGTPVRALADPTLERAFETRLVDSETVIRYNAAIPPDMPELARIFFYAHECARVELGSWANASHSVGDAWRADCRALGSLQHSGLINGNDLAILQKQLDSLPAAAFDLLPGPPRVIDLNACSRALKGDHVRVPTTPGSTDTQWNACVQPCADQLLTCQRDRCGTLDCPTCLPAHEACVARCN